MLLTSQSISRTERAKVLDGMSHVPQMPLGHHRKQSTFGLEHQASGEVPQTNMLHFVGGNGVRWSQLFGQKLTTVLSGTERHFGGTTMLHHSVQYHLV
jgi:hypothetical protein